MFFGAIPIYYQLLKAYHPAPSYSPPVISIVTPTPANILGVTTTKIVPSPIPENIGGEGQVITIGILGDSMIETLGTNLSALKTSLAQYFPRQAFNLLNYGASSQTIEYGLKQQLPLLIAQKPDIIVVESFAYNNFGNSESGLQRHQQALSSITATIKKELPDTKIIIATTIAPNTTVFGNGIKELHLSALEKIERTSTIKLYLQNTVNFATSFGLPLADTYHLSLFGDNGLKELINSEDNLHPSASGAILFSDVLADTIFKNK